MTRVALKVEKILEAARVAGLADEAQAEIMDLYKLAYAEGYQDGKLDTEEAHEDEWVEGPTV